MWGLWLHLKMTYVGAWTREEHETSVQRWIEAATSIVAPLLLLSAAVEVSTDYWENYREVAWFVIGSSVAMVALSLGTLLFACASLEAHLAGRAGTDDDSTTPLRGSPMLVFAAFLFSGGAAFTTVEVVDHFVGSLGFLNEEGAEREAFDSPWGDILLAFSAVCMLVEEFILLTMYDSVKREAMRIRRQGDVLKEEVKVVADQAEKKSKDMTGLLLAARERGTKIAGVLADARREGSKVEEYRRKIAQHRDRAGGLLSELERWRSDAGGTLKTFVTVVVLVVGALAVLGWIVVSTSLARHDRAVQERLARLDGLIERYEEPADVSAGSEGAGMPDEAQDDVTIGSEGAEAPGETGSEGAEAQDDVTIGSEGAEALGETGSEEAEAPGDVRTGSGEPGEPADALAESEEQGEPVEVPAGSNEQPGPVDGPAESDEPGEPAEAPTESEEQGEPVEVPAGSDEQQGPAAGSTESDEPGEPADAPAESAEQGGPVEVPAGSDGSPGSGGSEVG